MCTKKFSQPKRAGCCVCCGEEIYQVWASEGNEASPFFGHPVRLGRLKDIGTLVTFRLSNGSFTDIGFCLDCAAALTPAEYPALWTVCCDRSFLAMQHDRRSLNEQKVADARWRGLWIVGRLGKARESVTPGVLMVDRR